MRFLSASILRGHLELHGLLGLFQVRLFFSQLQLRLPESGQFLLPLLELLLEGGHFETGVLLQLLTQLGGQACPLPGDPSGRLLCQVPRLLFEACLSPASPWLPPLEAGSASWPAVRRPLSASQGVCAGKGPRRGLSLCRSGGRRSSVVEPSAMALPSRCDGGLPECILRSATRIVASVLRSVRRPHDPALSAIKRLIPPEYARPGCSGREGEPYT